MIATLFVGIFFPNYSLGADDSAYWKFDLDNNVLAIKATSLTTTAPECLAKTKTFKFTGARTNAQVSGLYDIYQSAEDKNCFVLVYLTKNKLKSEINGGMNCVYQKQAERTDPNGDCAPIASIPVVETAKDSVYDKIVDHITWIGNLDPADSNYQAFSEDQTKDKFYQLKLTLPVQGFTAQIRMVDGPKLAEGTSANNTVLNLVYNGVDNQARVTTAYNGKLLIFVSSINKMADGKYWTYKKELDVNASTNETDWKAGNGWHHETSPNGTNLHTFEQSLTTNDFAKTDAPDPLTDAGFVKEISDATKCDGFSWAIQGEAIAAVFCSFQKMVNSFGVELMSKAMDLLKDVLYGSTAH